MPSRTDLRKLIDEAYILYQQKGPDSSAGEPRQAICTALGLVYESRCGAWRQGIVINTAKPNVVVNLPAERIVAAHNKPENFEKLAIALKLEKDPVLIVPSPELRKVEIPTANEVPTGQQIMVAAEVAARSPRLRDVRKAVEVGVGIVLSLIILFW